MAVHLLILSLNNDLQFFHEWHFAPIVSLIKRDPQFVKSTEFRGIYQ